MKRLLAAAALMTLALTAVASATRTSAAGTVSSSRLVDGGNIRITATIGTPVAVGRPLNVTYRVRNLSQVTRKIRLAFTLWYVVHAQDGTTYDSRTLLRGAYLPYVPPTKLRPGQTVTRSGGGVRVRWAGPLRVTPGWGNEPLPRVSVRVRPSAAPSRQSAVAAVVSATGHLLDHCAPTTSGVAVIGRIDAPKHSAPPLRARCSVTLYREDGFFQAQVLIVSPPGLRGVHLRHRSEQLSGLKAGENATAIAWLFVVTQHGATSVDSTSVDSTKNARRMAPDWQWTTSGWTGQEGGARCGHTGGGGGGSGGPLIEFVSACAR
jgi:hypothetical protein